MGKMTIFIFKDHENEFLVGRGEKTNAEFFNHFGERAFLRTFNDLITEDFRWNRDPEEFPVLPAEFLLGEYRD